MQENINRLTNENKDLAAKYSRERERKESLEKDIRDIKDRRRVIRRVSTIVILAALIYIIVYALKM